MTTITPWNGIHSHAKVVETHPLPLSFSPVPFLPIEVGSLNPARGAGEQGKLPSGVCGAALAKIEFGAF